MLKINNIIIKEIVIIVVILEFKGVSFAIYIGDNMYRYK
jgi:hypothetical protein